MNIQELNIIKYLGSQLYVSQRELADNCKCSLGMANRCLKSLQAHGYVNENNQLTGKGIELLSQNRPQRAVILAAGTGMRMVPVNMEQPKAMLQINGEVLIERLISQLHQVGIREIYVVVGFMKEAFEYLIDRYGVELIVNRDYAAYNNLHSLALVKEKISNTYILPCDVWIQENPFSREEAYSWYMVTDAQSHDSKIRVNRKQELVRIRRGEPGNPMVGISYITENDAQVLKKNMDMLCRNFLYDHAFWEEALSRNESLITWARSVPQDQVYEINTYSQLQELAAAPELQILDGMRFVCEKFNARPEDLQDMQLLKKGMTNHSYRFTYENNHFVLRIPVKTEDSMINRSEEKAVYAVLQGEIRADELIFLDPQTGYKVSRYLDGARGCDPGKPADVHRAMELLKSIRSRDLKTENQIDLFDRIEFYEHLWRDGRSAYRDYDETKKNVFSLRAWLQKQKSHQSLTHMDTTPDNFLFYRDTDGQERVCLIDWECAGMQDPHVDIAMFGINALYGKEAMDRLIDIYFEGSCPALIRVKIYCYVAVCGLMWSNWCEYQLQNGAEFGEYSLKQYRYAKEFYRYAAAEISGLQCDEK